MIFSVQADLEITAHFLSVWSLGKSIWELILEQFDDLLVKILLSAAIISFVSRRILLWHKNISNLEFSKLSLEYKRLFTFNDQWIGTLNATLHLESNFIHAVCRVNWSLKFIVLWLSTAELICMQTLTPLIKKSSYLFLKILS